MARYTLLTAQSSSPKLEHSTADASAGYLSAVLYLAPHKLSGRNLCPNASPGCIAACLNLAGRGGIMKQGETTNPIQTARIRRSRLYLEHRAIFMDELFLDICAHRRAAQAQGKVPTVRLNGTSDIPWENVHNGDGLTVFEAFPDVTFYDYTKSTVRAYAQAYGSVSKGDGTPPVPWPRNYVLTYSRSERSDGIWIRSYLKLGGRVSVVYRGGSSDGFRRASRLVDFTFAPSSIVDGDATDYRFLDPAGSVNLLRAKGPAARDRSGFVIDP